jgi:hypothetical protein
VSAYTKDGTTGGALVVHVVNYDVPIHDKGKSGPPVDVEGLTLGLPLPAGWRATSVETIEPGQETGAAPFVQEGGRITVTVPRLSIYKVLRINCDRDSLR